MRLRSENLGLYSRFNSPNATNDDFMRQISELRYQSFHTQSRPHLAKDSKVASRNQLHEMASKNSKLSKTSLPGLIKSDQSVDRNRLTQSMASHVASD